MDKKNEMHWHQVVGVSTEEMQQAAREAEEKYGDIINREHPVSTKHPQMSRESRAAQFSPFAALANYDAVIRGAEEKHLEDMQPESEAYIDNELPDQICFSS